MAVASTKSIMRDFGGGWSGDWRIYGAESRLLPQLR
jgi:hypothetical protein